MLFGQSGEGDGPRSVELPESIDALGMVSGRLSVTSRARRTIHRHRPRTSVVVRARRLQALDVQWTASLPPYWRLSISCVHSQPMHGLESRARSPDHLRLNATRSRSTRRIPSPSHRSRLRLRLCMLVMLVRRQRDSSAAQGILLFANARRPFQAISPSSPPRPSDRVLQSPVNAVASCQRVLLIDYGAPIDVWHDQASLNAR
jgi:hypothetical protein